LEFFFGEPVMNVFCQRCGSGMPGSAHFCSTCGAAIPAAQPIPGRPLLRPRFGRQIGGVCIALAQANGWDVALVRIIAVIGLIFSSGLVGVAYLAAWIGIPEETPPLPGAYPPGV
jgi:phage shock protein PspC (stress-responsive transcriptional regulator)